MKHAQLLRPALFASALLGAPLAAAAQDATPPTPPAPSPAAAPAETAGTGAPAAEKQGEAEKRLEGMAAPEGEKRADAEKRAEGTEAAAEEGGAAQPTQVSVGDVTITGEQFEMDPATGLITVTGNPRAVRGDEDIRATRMVINPRTLQFTAEGDVIIRQGTREIRSTRATYSFDQKSGQAEQITSAMGTYYLKADQLILKPGPEYEARRASFSTCDREHKHWEIYSRVMEIVPGEEVVARNSGVDFLGMRLFTIPRYRKSLREDEDDPMRFPSFGYDNWNGPYVRQNFTIHRGAPLWVDADVQINAFREPMGGFRMGTAGKLKFVATAFYRDIAENQRSPHMQVSRLPEVGVVWSSAEAARPGRFLGARPQSLRYPQALDLSTKWIFAAEATAGYFRQHHGQRNLGPDSVSKNGGRFLVQGQAILPLVKLGPVSLNDLRLMARDSVYDNGDNFFTYGFGIGKRVRFGNWQIRADYFQNFSEGKTPFLFDDIELRKEIRPALDFTTRNFEFSYMARINPDRGNVYDQVFSVSKLFHCLRPTLMYSVRRNEIFFELRIPGLNGGVATPPGQPRTQESVDRRRGLYVTDDGDK